MCSSCTEFDQERQLERLLETMFTLELISYHSYVEALQVAGLTDLLVPL